MYTSNFPCGLSGIFSTTQQVCTSRVCKGMNFGGGGSGGGVPPYGGGIPPYGSQMPLYGGGAAPLYSPYGMPMQPMAPGTGMPLANAPQYAASGHGPLGEAQPRLGANGLYEAPEPEGPEEHGKLELGLYVGC